MQQAEDFREVSGQLDALLNDLSDADFHRVTGFKQWTVEEILRHLHVWNHAAHIAATKPDQFGEFMAAVAGNLRAGDVRSFEAGYLNGLAGRGLLAAWREFYGLLADTFLTVDPAVRMPWAGPDMSARSMITARIMETWSHAQAIYDELGVERPATPAIRNIVVLGYNTYGWTFANRGMSVPKPVPQLVLTGPDGSEWIFGEATEGECIAGSAVEFCQVVTQTRNIADTELQVTGANARAWMDMAQCFAGPPQDPPPPGTRFRKAVQVSS